MRSLPAAFAGLGAYRQFVAYRLTPNKDNPAKMDKKPVNPYTGIVCDPHNPDNWATFEQALNVGADGAGFVLTANDPFWFLDIDNCYDAATETWSPLAQTLLNLTAGAAVEVSQSGTGLHIIGSGKPPVHGCKNTALGLELYHEKRFVALTGRQTTGAVSFDGTAILPGLVRAYFATATASLGSDEPDDWTDAPVTDWNGYDDDDELIAAALRSRSARAQFGKAVSFTELWNANGAALALAFPDTEQGREYDASSADASLAAHLAFWTGCNCERMLSLMWRSSLVRDKWEREDYLRRTILNACARQTKVHSRRRETPDIPAIEAGDLIQATAGSQLMFPSQQAEYFAGCCYVRNLHAVFVPQDGALLKPEQFKAAYGGYTFILDNDGASTTKNAWDCFTNSQALRFPRVVDTQFRPDLVPGAIFETNGRKLINSYVPIPVSRVKGDPSPFLRLLEKMLPVEHDRQIVLAYMAACVQHRGVKFQWCLLIQGVEGNGKTTINRIVAEAIGMDHVATPKAEEVSNKFNSWIRDKLFVYIEDVYYADHKREIIESLKPLITNDWVPVEPKGVDQTTTYVCANFILNCNYKDALPKTRNDRRFAVFFTAQQSVDDLERDGMGGRYFPDLYHWLKHENGYAILTDYLYEYDIPDMLNPATLCHRAPETSTTLEALALGMGHFEAIESGRPGFAGGWISSMALDRLLDSLKAGNKLPRPRRREVLQSLGYDYHPSLRDGRVNNYIAIDGGKPRLFIRSGHIHAGLKTTREVVDAYIKAQGIVDAPVAPLRVSN